MSAILFNKYYNKIVLCSLSERLKMNPILPQVNELLATLKELMPTPYQQETLEAIFGLLLEGQGNSVPHHLLIQPDIVNEIE